MTEPKQTGPIQFLATETSPSGTKCKYCNRTPCGTQFDPDDAKQLRICREALRVERDSLLAMVKATGPDILGRKCHECGAEWMTDMQLDVLADKVDPYIVKNRALTARLRDLAAEREALLELERVTRLIPGFYRSELQGVVLNKLDALRTQPSPTREAKDLVQSIREEAGKCPTQGCVYTGGHNGACFTPGSVVPATSATVEAKPAEPPQEHLLKTWPSEWEAIRNGFKRFEWRKNDRPLGYRVGDTLVLRQYDPIGKNFVGEFQLPQRYYDLRALVTYVLRGDTIGSVFGVPHGYCIMSISLLSKEGGNTHE